jgi:hypothetical protein
LDATDECFRNLEFLWIGRLVPSVQKGFLQNSQTNDKVTREEQGLQLDRRMPSQLSRVEEATHFGSSVDPTGYQ